MPYQKVNDLRIYEPGVGDLVIEITGDNKGLLIYPNEDGLEHTLGVPLPPRDTPILDIPESCLLYFRDTASIAGIVNALVKIHETHVPNRESLPTMKELVREAWMAGANTPEWMDVDETLALFEEWWNVDG